MNTQATQVQTLPAVKTAAERKSDRAAAKLVKQDKAQAAAAARVQADVANQVDHGPSNARIAAMLASEAENTSGMTPAQIKHGKETQQLKATARANYELDGGNMAETFTADDYGNAITQHKTAAKAWTAHMKTVAAAKEQVDMEPAEDEEGDPAPTGYQGPMKALRDRVKAGLYTKAANGQPSCGDEVATILGSLEPAEVIRACLIAMAIANPYGHLNIGQQSMNLRNKLRGQLKRNEIGMGVLREAVEEVMESRPAPKAAPAPEAAPAPVEVAPAPEAKPAKAKRAPKPAK